MPTLPPERPNPPGPWPYQQRRTAESFGVDPERYDRTRPRYPDALVRRIVTASPGPDVLDVGCGTGIAARQFHAAGCTVLGVEPDSRMAEFARRSGVEVEEGRFEDWDPAGRSFDTVIAGQSWHWVDPAEGPAKAARVLRPGGRLAAIWHTTRPPIEVVVAFSAAVQRLVPHASPLNLQEAARRAPEGYRQMFASATKKIRAVGGFSDPEQWRFEWEQSYTRDEWLETLPTSGLLTRVPPDERAEVLESVGAAIDALGGGFTAQRAVVAVTAVRTGDV
ncbi:class I SAM-dependent methyltransferase [Marinactinospora rubrisoli]|uniref:Class I SAM-dependent methyltransferase n=1 Tax=Marinactinospora rubrisoli TaxID=2715399 RepID=A0ABW2KF59_9ACTN